MTCRGWCVVTEDRLRRRLEVAPQRRAEPPRQIVRRIDRERQPVPSFGSGERVGGGGGQRGGGERRRHPQQRLGVLVRRRDGVDEVEEVLRPKTSPLVFSKTTLLVAVSF